MLPNGFRVSCAGSPGGEVGATLWKRDGSAWHPAASECQVAAFSLIELKIPMLAFGQSPLLDVSFFVTVHDAQENEVERHPAGRPVELTVPDDRFEARNWSA